MRVSHKDKLKMARKLRSRNEQRRGVPVFQTQLWTLKKEAAEKRHKERYGRK